MWQANTVQKKLESHGYETQIVGISSQGDQSIGGDLASSVGQFIHAVDSELLSKNIDIAVHSSKDVPVDLDDSVSNIAYIERGCTNDVLLFQKTENTQSLKELFNNTEEMELEQVLQYIPESGMVGTVSGRRQSFLLSQRPDIVPIAVRGQIETRLKRLQENRVDSIILAEIGLRRLHEINALESWILELGAVRISDLEWPTAPGQGSVSVHCRSEDVASFQDLREILNHPETEKDVLDERHVLSSIGGGCLYPAGIKINSGKASIKISPQNWRELFCNGFEFEVVHYQGELKDLDISPPIQTPPKSIEVSSKGPQLISTLNSDRLAKVLGNDGIPVLNKPVLELVAKPQNWPEHFIQESTPRSQWPYLVLTSPFAAKCALEVAKENGDLNRIQWLAIGEGTARACFKRGVTVSICAKARNSIELTRYIDQMIDRNIRLMVPRSNVASKEFVDSLTSLGFDVDSWVGYENKAKEIEGVEMGANDVLLLSSPSSAQAWMKNSLPIPKNILCMGKSSREEITSMEYFSGSTVEVLQGPTAKFIAKWWKKYEVEL
tara:strand:+ start:789 stop:2444 length:1656 start_codon:yes stop_codon:yes gene_type:complete